MANKPLKSVKFPGLPDTYTVPQFDSATGGMGTQGTIPDSKAVKDSIDTLKEDLNAVSGATYYEWKSGRITTSGSTVDVTAIGSSSGKHILVDCTNIPYFICTSTGNSTYRPYCFVDANGNKLLTAPANYLTNYLLRTPSGAKWLVINANTDSPNFYLCSGFWYDNPTAFKILAGNKDAFKGLAGQGNYVVSNGAITDSGIDAYKVRTAFVSYPYEVNVSCNSGYKFSVCTEAEGVYSTSASWQKNATIPANTNFALTITTDPINADYTLSPLEALTNLYVRRAGGTYVLSTGDTTDRTAEIKAVLNSDGIARLGKGVFYVKNLVLDEGQAISGEGNSTVLRLADDGTYALKLNSYTKVSNLRIIGADEDITIPDSDFTPEEGDTDYLEGVTWTDSDGYTKTVFADSLPAGMYKFNLNATSDNENTNYIFVKFVDQSAYSSSHVVHSFYTDKDELIEKTIKFDAPVKSIWIFAAGSPSAASGYSVTVNNAALYTITSLFGTRTGILWETPSAKDGVVTNCMIERFNCAGILARDTGGGVDCNLYVSDTFVRNCIVGLFIQKNSEFLRVCNNTFVRNFYGILTRGGNTYVSNCGLDANRIGLQVDNEEGSNGGHGSISNCSINHADNNTGYGLVIKGTGRELITNCNFYYAKIKLLSTNGNVISNCGFGNDTGIEIDAGSGRCNMITDSMFRTRANAITVTSGIVKVNNCWTREGNEVTAT